MDKIAQYRTYIQRLLEQYAQYKPSYGDLTVTSETNEMSTEPKVHQE